MKFNKPNSDKYIDKIDRRNNLEYFLLGNGDFDELSEEYSDKKEFLTISKYIDIINYLSSRDILPTKKINKTIKRELKYVDVREIFLLLEIELEIDIDDEFVSKVENWLFNNKPLSYINGNWIYEYLYGHNILNVIVYLLSSKILEYEN